MLSFIPIVLAVFMTHTLQPHWVLTTTLAPGFSLLRVPWSDSLKEPSKEPRAIKSLSSLTHHPAKAIIAYVELQLS